MRLKEGRKGMKGERVARTVGSTNAFGGVPPGVLDQIQLNPTKSDLKKNDFFSPVITRSWAYGKVPHSPFHRDRRDKSCLIVPKIFLLFETESGVTETGNDQMDPRLDSRPHQPPSLTPHREKFTPLHR